MRFTVATAKLRDAVSKACVVTPRRPAFYALEQVKIFCAGDGATLYATDLEVGVGIGVNAEVYEDGSVCVNAASLRSILHSIKAGKLDVYTEGYALVLESPHLLFKLPTYSDFPELWQCSGQGDTITCQLSGALRHLSRFVSKDETKLALTGVLFEFKDNTLTLVATDCYRLGRFSFPCGRDLGLCRENRQFILPLKAVRAFCTVFDCASSVTLFTCSSGVIFRADAAELFVVPLNCVYPDYRKVFPEDFVATVEVDRRELINALREVSCIHQIADVVVSRGMILLKARSEVGAVDRRVEAKGDGEIETSVNTRYLTEGLEMFDDEKVVLRFSGQLSPIVIQNDYLLMPVRQQ